MKALIPLPLLGSLAISALTPMPTDTAWFASIRQNTRMPPSWVFAPVWTALYLMMGLAWSRTSQNSTATTLFLVQLFLNYAWSPIFFGLRRPDIALAVLVALVGAAGWATVVMWRTDAAAGWLMVPYMLWLAFALRLNYMVTNRA